MGRRIRIVVLVLGILAVVQFFVPHASGRWVHRNLLDWLVILESGALVAGVVALARHQVLQFRASGGRARIYPLLTLVGLGAMILSGILGPINERSLFDSLYAWLLQPIQATMLSLLVFYMASAAFRSFRLSSAPATILLAAALIVLLGRVPLGEKLVPNISLFSTWIIRVPNVGATRGLWIGIGLAGSATALRVILGIQGPASWKGR